MTARAVVCSVSRPVIATLVASALVVLIAAWVTIDRTGDELHAAAGDGACVVGLSNPNSTKPGGRTGPRAFARLLCIAPTLGFAIGSWLARGLGSNTSWVAPCHRTRFMHCKCNNWVLGAESTQPVLRTPPVQDLSEFCFYGSLRKRESSNET